jgi:hypothetical protein
VVCGGMKGRAKNEKFTFLLFIGGALIGLNIVAVKTSLYYI